MNPKEKVNELIERFKPIVYPYIGSSMLTNTEDEDIILQNAKVCALITVDELIEHFTNRCCESANRRYWEEVKEELNK